MQDDTNGISNKKLFEISLHAEIRTFHVVRDTWIYFATAKGLYRVNMANIETAKPEKVGGGGEDAAGSCGGAGGAGSGLQSNVAVLDILPWEAEGEPYVIVSLRDNSIRVYHGLSGELKHYVMSKPDSKLVQKLSILNPENVAKSRL